MPRGQYPRKRIPTQVFNLTFHRADMPVVKKGAKEAGMSVAAFIRWCVFKALGTLEHERQAE
jgi:hypothetical protein